MLPYRDADAALRDALLLSRAMSLKSAIADLELGGAWSVIIGDSGTDKTPALFEAYGRAIETFNGRFWAIVDVGTTASDLRHARTQSRYVTGLGGHPAAAADPSPITAEGVLRSAALAVRRLHESSLSGVPVAIQGVGQVGASLAGKFKSAGARLVIADVDADVARRVADETGAKIVSPELIAAQDVEVFCPCALGGTISNQTLELLQARIVAGGANNQLASPEFGRRLLERGVLYAPDYVANAGGIINIAGEIDASRRGKRFDAQWVSEKLDRLMKTLDDIFERSATENRPTDEIADDLANTRLARRAPKGNGCG
jgi:leucine dehydrogenase